MAVAPPPTPVLLYLGAGYDLSPLILFAPDPPYPVTTPHDDDPAAPPVPRTTYSSFLFVDAKPRHTSAFMVPDFDQWFDAPARVRNVLRYAQGMLDRWRIVDPDIIHFEGGGAPAHIAARRADPAWRFAPPSPPHPAPPPAPLTTLLYAFNTLDIELARTPALAPVWPRVAALYVHGLRPHPRTGLATPALQHVYALVGSWGSRRRPGARHVDFVRAARRRAHDAAAPPKAPFPPPPPASTSSLSLPDTSSSTSSSSSAPASPIAFRPPSWWDSDTTPCASPYASYSPGLTTASTLASTLDDAARAPPRFWTRIPQIAWDERRARYVVSVSVAESLRVWRARGAEDEEEDGESDADSASAYAEEDHAPRALSPAPPPPPPSPRPPRTRPRLRPRPPHIQPPHSPPPLPAHRARPFWRRAPEPRLDLADFLRGAGARGDAAGHAKTGAGPGAHAKTGVSTHAKTGPGAHTKTGPGAHTKTGAGAHTHPPPPPPTHARDLARTREKGRRRFGALRALGGAVVGLGRAGARGARCRCAGCVAA